MQTCQDYIKRSCKLIFLNRFKLRTMQCKKDEPILLSWSCIVATLSSLERMTFLWFSKWFCGHKWIPHILTEKTSFIACQLTCWIDWKKLHNLLISSTLSEISILISQNYNHKLFNLLNTNLTDWIKEEWKWSFEYLH